MKVIIEDIKWLTKELSEITLKEFIGCVITVILAFAYILFIY